MRFVKSVFFIFLFFIHGHASMFAPLSLDDQLKESDGVIWGVYLGDQFKKLPTGEVVTVGSFKIKLQAGLKYGDLLNRNKIDVLYPGGKWQGIEYSVTGSPQFKKNEEALLFLKKTNHGFVIQNLSLGKYSITESRNDVKFHSTVFRNHPKLGEFSLNQLNSLLLDRFNSNLDSIASFSVSVKNIRKKTDRSIASSNSLESGLLTSEIPLYWLVIIFTLLSLSRKTLYRIWKRS
jgi:hypothetical protein